jgi:hypothetical protein
MGVQFSCTVFGKDLQRAMETMSTTEYIHPTKKKYYSEHMNRNIELDKANN